MSRSGPEHRFAAKGLSVLPVVKSVDARGGGGRLELVYRARATDQTNKSK